MGLGDDLVAALATVIPILRKVERLVAFDNRMTDYSVFRVVKAVQGMPCLTHLGETYFRFPPATVGKHYSCRCPKPEKTVMLIS